MTSITETTDALEQAVADAEAAEGHLATVSAQIDRGCGRVG